MKNVCILFCAVFILFSFSACVSQQQVKNGDSLTSDITEWPENEYTAAVPEPHEGTPVTEIRSGDFYGIELSGVSRQECYGYIELLEASGFESAFPGEENQVSGGWIYTNGNAAVTVSQSGDAMVVGVSFRPL